jgi:hypothetical protein
VERSRLIGFVPGGTGDSSTALTVVEITIMAHFRSPLVDSMILLSRALASVFARAGELAENLSSTTVETQKFRASHYF